jgi:hypothetical protein
MPPLWRPRTGTRVGNGSANMCRGQGAYRQKKRRTCRWMRTGVPAMGMSATVRLYELCTAEERCRQPGHAAERRRALRSRCQTPLIQ